MINSKSLTLAIFLSVSVGLVFWVTFSWDLQQRFNNLPNDNPAFASYPISYITNTRTQQFDRQGLLNYTLDAKIIRQFKVGDIATPDLIIDYPYLTIYDTNTSIDIDTDTGTKASNDTTTNSIQRSKKLSFSNALQSTSTVSADVAEGFESKDTLTLKGNVVVMRTLKNGGASELRTSVLYLEPSRRYAQTDKPVTIHDAGGVIKATGMKIFFNEQRVELLSAVIGRYSPR
ncbi:MAG: lipopolysaccharide export system protein LptC [Pseudohongiellaceae bacterium]|jgi:lipopolysaccharide export system protein LptC